MIRLLFIEVRSTDSEEKGRNELLPPPTPPSPRNVSDMRDNSKADSLPEAKRMETPRAPNAM